MVCQETGDSKSTTVAVLGGTGFLGSALAVELARAGIHTRVASRHPGRVPLPATPLNAGGIEEVFVDIRDRQSVAAGLAGCYAAINAVGLYTERKAETFQAIHIDAAHRLAQQASELGLERFIHISGIGVDSTSASAYIRARAEGEIRVWAAFEGATILRPSAMFGENDSFINSLLKLIDASPVLPLVGRGDAAIQPVFVGDVARAAVNAITQHEPPGSCYELGGPEVFSYRTLFERIKKARASRCLLLPLPVTVWRLLAHLCAILPTPPVTAAQVELMRHDNTVSDTAKTFADLAITPTALQDIFADLRE